MFMGVITRAHQRPRFHVAKTASESRFPQELKLLRGIKARDWQMVARRTQVLSEGEDIHSARTEIVENFHEFGGGFAQSHH